MLAYATLPAKGQLIRSSVATSQRSRPAIVRCAGSSNNPSMPVANPIIRLASFASGMLNNGLQKVKAAASEAARQTNEEAINQNIKESIKQMRMLAIIAPFAAVSGSADTFFIITKAVASFIKVRHPYDFLF